MNYSSSQPKVLPCRSDSKDKLGRLTIIEISPQFQSHGAAIMLFDQLREQEVNRSASKNTEP
jgi:hypothetical protein